ncbi:uncharacterized membrane protein At3g27390 isoform X1 [Lolium perenne]|uniref:uncharacterized membrane protein At3g27390 isoform X1 n=2 Tax=Lolium perenne TaxID=4522 RepID=UPI0021F5FA86|nr:uncharacterized membrane protein At3g27390-like isoform X1 [Lolium perenne]
MEPATGFRASAWSCFKFLPFFCGLLLLGIIKAVLFGPWACLIMAVGISALVLGLWPVHVIWTYYCIIRTKLVGPVVKLLLLISASGILVLWLIVGIVGSVLAGLAYGFLAPVMATFDAVGEGKERPLVHCFVDGTWTTITGGCTVVRDLKDMLLDSYFSFMDDLRLHEPPGGKPFEIRVLDIPGAVFAGAFGLLVDGIMFTLIAVYKFPVMLFKGWKRLIEDLVGREGPFLETVCVPFAGLAILLWPFAVFGAFLASIISSVPLGVYAAIVVYQESSLFMGLSYAISSVSIFDEYTNDVLDMAPGSCFPRFHYRKNQASAESGHLSRPASFKDKQDGRKAPIRVTSFKSSFEEFNPFKALDQLFEDCKHRGVALVAEGVITQEDIEETKSGKVGSGVINVGLPAYVILNALLRSAKANSDGLLLRDGCEITSDNRPKNAIFDWFFDPLMVIKDQIKADNFTEEEEVYLQKRVLLISDPKRLKATLPHLPSLNERKQAEIDAFARRLQGITKSILRYPTSKRRFDDLVKALSEEHERAMGGSRSVSSRSQFQRLRSGVGRMLSQRSMGRATSVRGNDQEAQLTNNARAAYSEEQ